MKIQTGDQSNSSAAGGHTGEANEQRERHGWRAIAGRGRTSFHRLVPAHERLVLGTLGIVVCLVLWEGLVFAGL